LTPVLSFSAEVIQWDFRITPPVGELKHYVKANASPGSTTFQMVMTVKPAVELEEHRLAISWMGIGKQIVNTQTWGLSLIDTLRLPTDKRQLYPGTSQKHPELAVNKLFKDMDEWITDEWNGSMEVLMYGGVCGIVEV
jgi:hypothetical protein